MEAGRGIVGIFNRLYAREIDVEQADAELKALRDRKGLMRGFFASLAAEQQSAALANTEVDA